MTKLDSCPFCGSEAVMETFRSGEQSLFRVHAEIRARDQATCMDGHTPVGVSAA